MKRPCLNYQSWFIASIPWNHATEDNFLPFLINNNEIFLTPGIVGTQEKCPYLQAAACTSFSSHPVDEVRELVKQVEV